jgi:acetyl esterase/lipase
VGGTSAGANLVLVTTLMIKEQGLAMPGALFVGTPVVDVVKHNDSAYLNDCIDHVIVSMLGGLIPEILSYYVGENSPDNPHISPIHGDFTGFPPTYLISGTRDVLLSDTALAHRKLRQAGVEADLNIYEGFAHGDYGLMFGTPEQAEHFKELNAFLLRHLQP